MRGGKVVDRAAASERTPEALVEAMVGRGSIGSLERPKPPSSDVPALQVRDLAAEVHGRKVRDISFELAAGEILGVAGVSGNGQFALAEALAGLVPITGGDVILDGVSIASRNEDGGINGDIAYIPERPVDNAVVADLDLSLNLALRHARELAFFPSRRDIEARAGQLIAGYDVRPPRPALAASALSGGNLQNSSSHANCRIARGW
jgi:ABC-type uncharacterized transport systems, ATPase components